MKNLFRILAALSLLLAGLGTYQPVSGAPVLQDGPVPLPGSDIFLPLLSRNASSPGQGSLVTYTGRVVDEANRPVPAVTVIDNQGRLAVTDGQGQYSLTAPKGSPLALAAVKEGYTFMPSMISLDSGSQSTALDPILAVAACQEEIANGSFANATAQPWVLVNTARSARLQTNFGHTDTRSALTGIQAGEKNVFSYSDLYQIVGSIPRGIDSAILRLWLYPVSSESAQEAVPARPEAPGPEAAMAEATMMFGQAALASDVQYVMVLDTSGNILDTLLWTRSDSRTWTLYEFNLARYAGRSIRLQIGTFNNGSGGLTSMNVDDVSLQVCETDGGAGGCSNAFDNSGFEFSSGWSIPATRYPAAYSTQQVAAGSRSMRTGITATADNTFSYSDAYQLATLPRTATRVTLNLSVFLQTTSPLSASAQAEPARASQAAPFGAEALAEDAQYILVLNNAGYILEYLYWTRSNTGAWNQLSFDLTDYRGSTIRIQFGTFNNGDDGITSMFVDQAFLDVCTGAVGPTPTPTPTTVPPTPTPSPTPVPTPLPGACAEAVLNGSFETDSAWTIPLTNFAAGYSNRQVHSGTRSMRSGIVFTAHDRFSYSDFRQQVVIPEDSASATLTAWMYQETEDPLGQDSQYVLVLNRFGYWIDTLYLDLEDEQGWVQRTFDLSDYISDSDDVILSIHFGTFNDGLDGVSSMFVDDVSLQVCAP